MGLGQGASDVMETWLTLFVGPGKPLEAVTWVVWILPSYLQRWDERQQDQLRGCWREAWQSYLRRTNESLARERESGDRKREEGWTGGPQEAEHTWKHPETPLRTSAEKSESTSSVPHPGTWGASDEGTSVPRQAATWPDWQHVPRTELVFLADGYVSVQKFKVLFFSRKPMEWIKEHKCSLIAAKIKLAVTNQQKRNMIILVRAHKRLTKLKICWP